MTEEEEVNKAQEKSSCGKLILRLLFSHVGLFLLVCLYCAFGAWIFVTVEQEEEERVVKERLVRSIDVNDSLDYLTALFYFWRDKDLSWPEWESAVYKELKELDMFIVDTVQNFNYDGTYDPDTWHREWTFGNGLLYCVTILTTIGYGHVTPSTQMGKIVTILYSMIGIPLAFVFLANIGDLMASVFRYSYSRCCCRWCRSSRRKSEYTREMVISMGGRLPPLGKDEVGDEPYMPTDKAIVPIVLNLLLISLFTLMGALIFAYVEDWDLLSSGYFTFITLTTIGFGDFYPARAFEGYSQSFSKALGLIGTCLYMLMGMALVSMCINLMQEQLVEKMKWFGKEIGLIKEADIEDTKDEEDTKSITKFSELSHEPPITG